MGKVYHIWQFPERKCIIQLPDHVLETMRKMAKRYLPNETGGTLVGNYSKDKRNAHIIQALGVKKGARRKRFGFYRPPDSIDTQLTEIYRKSRGRIYYLGEWHTHPKASPIPSNMDFKTLLGLSLSASVATDTPLMIIFGNDFKSMPPATCILMEESGKCLYGIYERTKILKK